MINQTPTPMTNQSIGTSYGRVIRKRQQLGGNPVTLETFKAELAQQIAAGKLTRDDANERYKWAKEVSR
jgi:hypothetical protein